MIADILDMQARVAGWLGAGPEAALVWKWYPDREGLDLGLALHPFRLTQAQSAELVAILAAEFPALATVTVHDGFLNLHVTETAWADFVLAWADDLSAWTSRLRLPHDLTATKLQWPYRWLLVIHEAHTLANLPGWRTHAGVGTYHPTRDERTLVKQLLSLPGLLQQKGDRDRKRTEMMQGIFLILQSLWKQPILTATDFPGSAFRQALIQICIAMAGAVGDPLSQSPSDGLNIPV